MNFFKPPTAIGKYSSMRAATTQCECKVFLQGHAAAYSSRLLVHGVIKFVTYHSAGTAATTSSHALLRSTACTCKTAALSRPLVATTGPSHAL